MYYPNWAYLMQQQQQQQRTGAEGEQRPPVPMNYQMMGGGKGPQGMHMQGPQGMQPPQGMQGPQSMQGPQGMPMQNGPKMGMYMQYPYGPYNPYGYMQKKPEGKDPK